MALRWWNRGRFDVVELVVIGAFFAVAGGVVGHNWPQTNPVIQQLTHLYGTATYSYGAEETVIRDFFNDRRGGFFVDIGAADYKIDSNTFYLEERLGWSGIAVDALTSYAAGYKQHRPHTRFFARFVSDVDNSEATVFIPEDTRQAADWRRPEYGPADKTSVPTVTLSRLLTEQGVSHIDLLSVDVELAEPRVLAGFDIDRFHPALVCIEAFLPVRQPILDYFARHGYVVVGKYSFVDQRNLYFKPLEPTTRVAGAR